MDSNQLQTSILLTTESHRVVGRILNANQRLQDILNNKLSSCINVYEAAIYRPHEEKPVTHCAEVTLPKSQINLVLIQEQRHEAPTKRLFGYVQKDMYETLFAVAGYEVRGRLHFTSLLKPEILLTETTTSFLPVTQATVTLASDGMFSWEASVVFVRRFAISLFHLGEQV
jgi:hypothetical protein